MPNPPPSFYCDDIIALSRSNINAGIVPNAPAAMQTNPWCGDECRISAAFDNGCITRSLHQTRGCVLTLAAAVKATTMATQTGDLAKVMQLATAFDKMIKGKGEPPPGLELFAPVIPSKNRHACVLLPFWTLTELIQKQTH